MTINERLDRLERAVAELCDRSGIAFMRPRRSPVGNPGEANGNARLSATTVQRAKQLRAEGQTYVDIGRQLGVSDTAVSRAVRGRTWVER